MFRERLNEQKKILGISTKAMSERSRLHIPEETMCRVLTGKTADPGVSTVLDMGETVGIEPYELFMDSTLATEFKTYLSLKSRSEESEAERIQIIAENDRLKSANLSLTAEIERLRTEIKYKDEIIAIHNYYNNLKSTHPTY